MVRLIGWLWRPYLFGTGAALIFLGVQGAYGFPVLWLDFLLLAFCGWEVVRAARTSLRCDTDAILVCNGLRTVRIPADQVESVSVGPTWRSPGTLPTVFIARLDGIPVEVEAARLASGPVRDRIRSDLVEWCRRNHRPCALPQHPDMFWNAWKRDAGKGAKRSAH